MENAESLTSNKYPVKSIIKIQKMYRAHIAYKSFKKLKKIMKYREHIIR